MEQPPWPKDKHPWLQCELSWLRLGLHDSIISNSISTRAAAIVAGGAFGALFDPLDHRGTSSHVQDNPGAMEALKGAIYVHIGAMQAHSGELLIE
jgi:hypothetical protein